MGWFARVYGLACLVAISRWCEGVSGERVELLKDRARFFLGLARELLGRGRLDVSAFSVEQAIQLRVRASLLRFTGEIPGVHSIRELLGMLARVLEDLGFADEVQRVRGFVREHRDVLVDVEDAYTMARYAVFTAGVREVEEMIRVAEKLFKLLDWVEERVLG